MANQKKTFMSVLLNGLIWENPTFVLMLGMCPTLAITTSGMNGIGMGLAVTAVLSRICSSACCATSFRTACAFRRTSSSSRPS